MRNVKYHIFIYHIFASWSAWDFMVSMVMHGTSENVPLLLLKVALALISMMHKWLLATDKPGNTIRTVLFEMTNHMMQSTVQTNGLFTKCVYLNLKSITCIGSILECQYMFGQNVVQSP